MPESTVRASSRGARTSSSSHTASEMSCPPMSKAASDEFRRSALASAVQPSRVSPLSVRSRWTSAVRAGIVSHTSATPLSPTPLPARPRLSNRLQRDSPATRAPAPAAPTRLWAACNQTNPSRLVKAPPTAVAPAGRSSQQDRSKAVSAVAADSPSASPVAPGGSILQLLALKNRHPPLAASAATKPHSIMSSTGVFEGRVLLPSSRSALKPRPELLNSTASPLRPTHSLRLWLSRGRSTTRSLTVRSVPPSRARTTACVSPRMRPTENSTPRKSATVSEPIDPCVWPVAAAPPSLAALQASMRPNTTCSYARS